MSVIPKGTDCTLKTYNAVKDVSTALTIMCKDNSFLGDFSVLTMYSPTLSEMVQVTCETFGQCIFLPDFTVLTVSKLYELPSNGETIVKSREEIQRVPGYSGVIMMEPQLRYESL